MSCESDLFQAHKFIVLGLRHPVLEGSHLSYIRYILHFFLSAVICYQRDGCSSSGLVFEEVTILTCCDNVNGGGLGGIGLGSSYKQGGIEGCLICPIG